MRYEYDALGNLLKTIRPDGQEQSWLNYGSGHVYGVVFNQKDLVAFKRDDLHREVERLLANGLVEQKEYNPVGLLTAQRIFSEQADHTTHYQAQREYHYDQNYLLTQVQDSRLGQINYQYDPVGRLLKSQGQHLQEIFAFDPAGNLIDANTTGQSKINNNLQTQYQGAHYRYDAQGNVVEKQYQGKILKLQWDNLNRLQRSDYDGLQTDYGYDVLGRRIFKKQGRELTLFGWDGDLMIWESYQNQADDHAAYTKHYLYEPNSFVPLLHTGYQQFIQLIETPDYSQYQTKPYSVYKDPVWKDTRKQRAELERTLFYHCDQIGTSHCQDSCHPL
ncbi:hypothetical protein BFG52_15350 [Acinetobacter larvae]|uniref:Teneurin-like YD-shell domain-containing protein n=1 Tax=Acinetobacter larvae TaxID=1789224 RepID=A0A1B2M335_9GAMM|nr:hypothetical protein BFG52_15350 [Acinetobacter larvae]